MEVYVELGPEFKRQFKRLAKKYHSLRNDLDVWRKELVKNLYSPTDSTDGHRFLDENILSEIRLNSV